LFMFNLNPLIKLKNKLFLKEKQKYFNRPSFQKTCFQQNFWYYKQANKKNHLKLASRTFLRYFRKLTFANQVNLKPLLRKKTIKALTSFKSINYSTLQTVSTLNLSQTFNNSNLPLNPKIFKPFFLNSRLFSYFLVDYTTSLNIPKGQYLRTVHHLTLSTSFQLYKTISNHNFLSLPTGLGFTERKTISWNSQTLVVNQAPLKLNVYSSFFKNLPLFSFFLRQSNFFKTNKDTVTSFYPRGFMELWSKNFYILNRNTKSYNLKGGTLEKAIFQKTSRKLTSCLQTLLLNENRLENNFIVASNPNFQSPRVLLQLRTLFTRKFLISIVSKKRQISSILKIKTKKKLTNLFSILTDFGQPAQALKSVSLITSRNVIKPAKNTFLDLFFSNTSLLSYVLTNSLLFKYLFSSSLVDPKFSSSLLCINFSNLFSPSGNSMFKKSNLLPFYSFSYQLKRRVLKAFTYDTFSPNVTMWYYHTIIRFVENCTGKKVYLKFNPFIENSLTFNDLSRCYIWAVRVVRFQKVLGPRMFLRESLKIINVAIRYRDPTFLANWIRAMLKRTNFYKYKPLFRYLKYVFTHLFQGYFKDLGFKGLKLKLKGKICVAGNARTRTLFYRIGNTSHSTFDNRVVYDLSYINTFTGVLGFQLWFYY